MKLSKAISFSTVTRYVPPSEDTMSVGKEYLIKTYMVTYYWGRFKILTINVTEYL